ncbi:MAG: hypothetical protein PHN49_03900 [Candidatus Omnitrophica bacterium]|nr:hypothetical protein [Candidatus Omnitrophota bacterium]MDD5670763.1 hypothetical protein [Candidatus Omnitrophota bacterium]
MNAVRKKMVFLLLIGCVLLFADGKSCAESVTGFRSEVDLIGELIFDNECGGKDSELLGWNEGENFPSLGIGHFIWYPAGQEGPFRESFPELLSFFESKGVQLPEWFRSLKDRHAPWATRDAFNEDIRNGDLDLLREFLSDTKTMQTEFLVERLRRSIPRMLKAVSQDSEGDIRQKLSLILQTGGGLYPLVDYVNFNGDGVFPGERYHGQGWGLLQVLEEMKITDPDQDVIGEFVRAAESVVIRRVANSPPERNESRWLAGWKSRVRSYLAMQSRSEFRIEHSLRKALLASDTDGIPTTILPALDELSSPSAMT